ncbi:MAG: hypothetical protein M9964_03540 [Solirubrobacterales bacterium]|nr:hypothetical protein [Thermoleophilales bacterium]MCO5326116.1 hypothetical protein [Solirubrobacterales bacterium]
MGTSVIGGALRAAIAIAALAAVGVALLTASAATGAAGSPESPAPNAGADRAAGDQADPVTNGDCFWLGAFSVRRGPDYNFAFPDYGATYWSARYTLPAGATMRLKGKFPHARYESLHSYAVGGSTPLDHLADIDTAPDKGSTNPFLPGADRTAKKRRYTVAISPTTPPAAGEPRAANTVYAESSDQQLIYRVYVPDKGSDFAGDTGLPKPVLTLADGAVVTGQALCDAVGSEGHALSSSSLPLSVYLTLRDQPDKPSTFPAVNPTRFRAYYSTAFTVKCVYQGVCEPPPTRVGGQYSNLDVNYVGGFVNREFGPVLVLRGKMPTTPATLKGNDKMKRAQLRYWSMCQNESLTTTRGAGCLFDEQVPLTKKRRFTIVTSLPADRPDNARRKCGVGFIPWPADGDGAGHPNDGLLLVRNMLPSKSFHQAVQDTQVPGDEAEVMGPYLPKGSYSSVEQFEARGC